MNRGKNINNLPVLLVFIVNPILGIFAQFKYHLKVNEEFTRRIIYLLASIYLGLINTTVELNSVSDLPSYYDLYMNSDNFFELIKNSPYEIMYLFFSFVSYYLTFGDFKLFLLLYTVIVYQLVLVSIDTITSRIDKSNKFLPVLAALIFAFYHPHFLQSLNLMRQVLAGSIFFYFFTQRHINGKTNYIFPIMAVLIHRSSLILFVISFIPGISKKISVKNLLIISVIGFSIAYFSPYIISLFLIMLSPFPSLQSIFSQLQNIESTNYLWYSGQAAIELRLIYFMLIGILVFSARKLVKSDLSYILNYVFLYVIFLELLYHSNLLLMHYRMAIYINYFLPVALALVISQLGNIIIKYFVFISLALVIFYRFFNALSIYGIKYSETVELLFNPVFLYFQN